MPDDERFGLPERSNASILIDLALAEDLGQVGDLTAQVTIPNQAQGAARFVSRSAGVVAGWPIVALLAERFELGGHWQAFANDGDRIASDEVIARVAGAM